MTVVKVLVDSPNTDVNAKVDDGRTPLILAAQLDHVRIAKRLLEAGANASARDHRGFTAFHKACMLGNLATVKMFTGCKGVPIETRDLDQFTPLMTAALPFSDLKKP
jgi:hypothetical protein